MLRKTLFSASLATFVMVVGGLSASADTILIDLGRSANATTDAGWNNIIGAPGSGVTGAPDNTPLVNSLDVATSISATVGATQGGNDQAGFGISNGGLPGALGNAGVTNPVTGTVYPRNAIITHVFLRPTNELDDPDAEEPEIINPDLPTFYNVTLSGLSQLETYDFYFLAAGTAGTDVQSVWDVQGSNSGSTSMIDAATGNAAGDGSGGVIVSVLGISPDVNDEILISMTNPVGSEVGTVLARWNILEVVSNPIPEPGTLAVLGLGASVLMLRRSREQA